MSPVMRILILGASGMLGHTLCFLLPHYGFDVRGTVRGRATLHRALCRMDTVSLIDEVDAQNLQSVQRALEVCSPDVVINCIGNIRQRAEGQNKKNCAEINALFPHRLLELCRESSCRLIHYSTDCVFDGRDGNAPHREEDPPTATDVYGISKYLGEISEGQALTLRTSIIGHELHTRYSLVEWFLAAQGSVHGYSRALYNGLPACEHARILAEYVLPRKNLHGLLHVAGPPVSKYELLRLIAAVYGKDIDIAEECSVVENKTLYAGAFNNITGYVPPSWKALVASMRSTQESFLRKLS